MGDFGRKREFLSAETGKKAIDFLIKHSGNRKNLEVDFFGGEPLMNFGVVKEIVDYGRARQLEYNKTFKFTITTNGIGLTDEIISYINSEMENVVLSIDGRREVHDRMRPSSNGKGSFDLILPGAKKLVESRTKSYYIRGTFTAYNHSDFSKDVFFLADMGFDSVSVEPVVTDRSLDFAILPGHVPEICAEYERLAEQYYLRRKNGKRFSFFHYNIDLSGGPCLTKRLIGCGAGGEYLAVIPGGDIYPCHQFAGDDEMLMGNVHGEAIRKDTRERFTGNTVLAKSECSECWAKYYCSGGCAANNYHANGLIDKPYLIGCELEKKRLECAIAIYIKEYLDSTGDDQDDSFN